MKPICGICKKEIKGLMVLSPNLDETKRSICENCFKKLYQSKKLKDWKELLGENWGLLKRKVSLLSEKIINS